MAENITKEFTCNICEGLVAQKLKFGDAVNIVIEDDKLACYQQEKVVLGNEKGTNLLRVPIYRVNGFIFDTAENIISLSDESYKDDEMKGENIKEAALWLSKNASKKNKALVLSYKGGKNAPVNVIFELQFINRKPYKKFLENFEKAKLECIEKRKAKLNK